MIFVWEHAGAREVHALDFGGLSTYLRIMRNGTSFTGYYGVTADTPFRVFEYQTGMTNFRMGLAAWGGNAAVAAPADFEYYCVNPFGVAADAAPTNAEGPATGAAMSNAVAEPATTAAAADYLMISGLLLSDGSGSLNPITRVSLARAPGLPKAGTTFCVALAGAGGAELATYCFDDSLMDYETQKPLGSRPFLMFVPDRPGVADVTLRREELILARRTRSSNAPQVTVVEPAGGELWTGEGRIRWTASDADGDPLHFTVLFSADGKGSWRGLDVDVEGNELVVDSRVLPGTGQGYIRVLATDGLNTGQADSRVPIRVADKPPQVTISHPADGATWTPGTVLVLEGSSYDPEDGFLAGPALTWRSDKAGVLGTGTTVSLTALASGDHVITLTGRDAGGQEGNASIVLRVQRQTYLPLILRRAGWGQPTPTPPCALLFREDFSAAGLAGWTPTGGAWTNPGGAMQGASGPVADAWNIKALPAFNFTYEGTVTVRQGNIAGLSFRSTGGTQGYDLFVDVNGSRLVLARRPPYMALGTYAADIQRDRPYRLRVEARWGAIDAYLDGVKRISVIDRTYGMGNFGVYAWNSIAAYDDLIACGLSLPYEQRVDVGISTDTVDTAGRTWMADQAYVAGSWGYTGGTSGYTTHAIAGTEDDPLYQTNRWGSGAWGYKFDLPDGEYRVTLLWAETYWTATDKRVFDVKIEGQTVIAGLDVFALVGHDAAYQRMFDVTVSDGQLNIEFASVRDAALVAAIEVLAATSATPTPTASRTRTPTATVSPTRTPTATATLTTGPTATATATPSRTVTPIASPSPTASATATRTPSPTASPTVSATPSRTATPTASATASHTPSPTASPTASATPSRTATPTASATASRTPTRRPRRLFPRPLRGQPRQPLRPPLRTPPARPLHRLLPRPLRARPRRPLRPLLRARPPPRPREAACTARSPTGAQPRPAWRSACAATMM